MSLGTRELVPPCRRCGARYTGDLDYPHVCKVVTSGTCVSPTVTIPLERPKTPAELREEGAAKVLAAFRELGVLAP